MMNKNEINKFAIRDPKIANQKKCLNMEVVCLGLSVDIAYYFLLYNIIVCMSEIENGNHLNLCLIHELIIIFFCHIFLVGCCSPIGGIRPKINIHFISIFHFFTKTISFRIRVNVNFQRRLGIECGSFYKQPMP